MKKFSVFPFRFLVASAAPAGNRNPETGNRRSVEPGIRGFTLLEVIVASLIFTLVVAAAYGLLDSARSLSDRTEIVAAMQQEARAVLDTLRSDLQGTYGTASKEFTTDFVGTQGGNAEAPEDKLEMVGVNGWTVRSTTPEIDLTQTTYSIYKDAATNGRKLVRKREKRLTPVDTSTREEEGMEEIGPHVPYVRFRYYDGSSWVDSWDSKQSGTLPRAIEVTITVTGAWKDEEVMEKFGDKIYLPLAAETPAKTQ